MWLLGCQHIPLLLVLKNYVLQSFCLSTFFVGKSLLNLRQSCKTGSLPRLRGGVERKGLDCEIVSYLEAFSIFWDFRPAPVLNLILIWFWFRNYRNPRRGWGRYQNNVLVERRQKKHRIIRRAIHKNFQFRHHQWIVRIACLYNINCNESTNLLYSL